MGTVKALPPHLRLVRSLPGDKPAPTPPPPREVVLTDEVLMSFGNRPDVKARWPFMGIRLVAATNCGRCGNKMARQSLYNEATRVKRSLMGLPQNEREVLKQMLNATSIVMYVPTPSGVQRMVL